MNSVVEYTGEDFEKDTLTEGITLVDFGAAWCGPCQMLEPTLVELSKQVDYKIVKVDTDQYSELTQKYKVKSLPTMIIFLPIIQCFHQMLHPYIIRPFQISYGSRHL